MITLGIDCGTQSLKTVALDPATGEVLASESRSYGLVEGLPPGHLEQDPEIWWDALDETVRKVLAAVGDRIAEVAAIGVSGQQHGFVPLDSSHRVIRPAKLWCDTSTAPQCDSIRALLGGAKGVVQRTGNDMLPGFTAPKILWLKENEPENFHQLAHVALPHDYLNLRLTGTLRMEYGDASGTALMDVRTRTWSTEVCAAIDEGLAAKLPALGSSLEPVGLVLPGLAEQWGIPGSTVVSAGGGDNMMAAIGTGNLEPGTVTASLGTSGTIFACCGQPVVDPDGEIAAFCDSTDHWLPLLCTMNVTLATNACRTMFGWDHSRMDEEIASVGPGADGLMFLPYLQGERTPNLPHAQGSLHGMTVGNFTPAHMARAVMEGVTLNMAYGLRRMESLGLRVEGGIRLTGGGSRSPVWRKILADAFGHPVATMQSAEGAALGAAIQAAAAALPSEPLTDIARRCSPVDADSRVEPDPCSPYLDLLDRQNKLRARLW